MQVMPFDRNCIPNWNSCVDRPCYNLYRVRTNAFRNPSNVLYWRGLFADVVLFWVNAYTMAKSFESNLHIHIHIQFRLGRGTAARVLLWSYACGQDGCPPPGSSLYLLVPFGTLLGDKVFLRHPQILQQHTWGWIGHNVLCVFTTGEP